MCLLTNKVLSLQAFTQEASLIFTSAFENCPFLWRFPLASVVQCRHLVRLIRIASIGIETPCCVHAIGVLKPSRPATCPIVCTIRVSERVDYETRLRILTSCSLSNN